jgi:16S rRNA (cytosine1402-N4)-methyltransferase
MPVSESQNVHRSVLLDETVAYFEDIDEGTIVDATLGMGGHTEALLEAHSTVKVLGLDQDSAAIAISTKRLEQFGNRVKIVKSNFSDISSVVKKEGVDNVFGVLADLGVSSLQFDSESRGFSFRFDAPLDMRMDPDSDDPTAADLLATKDEDGSLKEGKGVNRSKRRNNSPIWSRPL